MLYPFDCSCVTAGKSIIRSLETIIGYFGPTRYPQETGPDMVISSCLRYSTNSLLASLGYSLFHFFSVVVLLPFLFG